MSTGQVALAFRHLPLPIHPEALQAAVAAECAGQQGRFWDVHDWLFNHEALDKNVLLALPESIEFDRQRFDECLLDGAVSDRIRASADEARAFGIQSTPAFFLGQRLKDGRVSVSHALAGVRPASELVQYLDAALAGGATGWRSWISLFRAVGPEQ
jgi:protein-disulfide isomerase